MSRYKLAVIIGRFQPLHYGHLHLMESALDYSDNVLILIGSSFCGQSHRNPFDYVRRASWIKNAFLGNDSINTIGISDYPHSNEEWLIHTTKEILEYDTSIVADDICIIGHSKDDTSSYLDHFPFDYIDVEMYSDFHATDIRNFIYSNKLEYVESIVPVHVYRDLVEYAASEECLHMVQEKKHQEDHMKPYDLLDFPPVFVTGDAVVLCNNHILLIKRGNIHGYGQWALPGGYLDAGETVDKCILRELHEETSLDISDMDDAHLAKVIMFDSPGRSAMARSITHAGLILIENRDSLPDISPNDDAIDVKWVHIDSLISLRTVIFLDHYHIMVHLIKLFGEFSDD